MIAWTILACSGWQMDVPLHSMYIKYQTGQTCWIRTDSGEIVQYRYWNPCPIDIVIDFLVTEVEEPFVIYLLTILAILTPAIVILFMHSALANILRCIILGRAILSRAPLFLRALYVVLQPP